MVLLILYFFFSGIMLYLEIQRGKAEMHKWSVRYRELGATALCTVRAAMVMDDSGQRELTTTVNKFLVS
jgi:hypothetical protein